MSSSRSAPDVGASAARRREHDGDRHVEAEGIVLETARTGALHRAVHRTLDEDVEAGPVVRDVDLEALGHPVVAGAARQLLVERLDILHVGERPGRLPDLVPARSSWGRRNGERGV